MPDLTCADCGHQHTLDGCRGEPTPSDLWAGVSPAACDCMGCATCETSGPKWCDEHGPHLITNPTPANPQRDEESA